jgi:hypothetical protein
MRTGRSKRAALHSVLLQNCRVLLDKVFNLVIGEERQFGSPSEDYAPAIALVADGRHRSTPAGALLLAALAYPYSRRYANVTFPRFGGHWT